MDFLKRVPIGQYVAGSSGWLRRIDPRVKFSWVLMFLITPILAGPLWRVCIVISLLFITFIGSLPLRVVWRTLVFLVILSCFFGLFAMFLPTNEVVGQLNIRTPQELPNAITFGPSWEILRFGPFDFGQLSIGPFVVDRQSAELGVKTSTLIFTVVYSVNLMLITTSPEDLMWTLRWFLTPLALIGFPLDRMSFQLLLALRFIPLVQEECQNLLRSLATRAVDFRKLGFKKSIGLILSVGERLLLNILLRAEQGGDALLIRRGGYLLSPDLFKPKNSWKKKSRWINLFSACLLIFVLCLRYKYGLI
ncbi:energy-coupling factor transporter transmembrane component T family protein [Prochlorococcus marinus]|uniref:energy-coupling factor transporter transmembrane component T family protein n=1 Tax=Prochlorococcus marinus TaxID=1219 RepID=UPI0022B419B5|nr:energy-coupling factor transporter transmembrane component T [Prochlorococcus marinus]